MLISEKKLKNKIEKYFRSIIWELMKILLVKKVQI